MATVNLEEKMDLTEVRNITENVEQLQEKKNDSRMINYKTDYSPNKMNRV